MGGARNDRDSTGQQPASGSRGRRLRSLPSSTRREVLRLGVASTLGTLAGCSRLLGGSADREPSPTLTAAPVPGDDPGSVESAPVPVGAVTELGDLRTEVEGVERLTRATILGFVIRSRPGDDLLALTATFQNTGPGYVALVVDQYEVAVDGRFERSIEPFDERTSVDRGGWAFAPGEVRSVTLHYQVPKEATELQLRGKMRVRTLPADTFTVRSMTTDLTRTAPSPPSLDGSLSAPIHGVGDRVSATGISVRVTDVIVPVDPPTEPSPAGTEQIAVALSVTNDGVLSYPVVVGLGGFGGMMLGDGDGAAFTDQHRFTGTTAGHRHYDDTRALAAGESTEGAILVTVPDDDTPLYLFWTPPVDGWHVNSGVTVNRFVWRVR